MTKKIENSPRCLHCSHLRTYEMGYSEWTITGMGFNCALGVFKDFDDESVEDEEKTLKTLSEKCPHFQEGKPEEFCINCETYQEFKKCDECREVK